MSISSPTRIPQQGPQAAQPSAHPRRADGSARVTRRGSMARTRALFEEAWQRTHRRREAIARAVLALVLVVVAAVVLQGRAHLPSGPSFEAPGEVDTGPVSGLLPAGTTGSVAAVGVGTGGSSDIYILRSGPGAPGRLTATSQWNEYAPSWSPDGTRLAYIRAAIAEAGANDACRTVCELVVADPATDGRLIVDLSRPGVVPQSVTWAPDGRALLIERLACGIGGCGGGTGSLIVDATSGGTMETEPEYEVLGWSPDGRWMTVVDSHVVDPVEGARPAVLLVPAGELAPQFPGGDATREGWVALSARSDYGLSVAWSPDSSSALLSEAVGVESEPGGPWTPATIDVITIPDGRRHTIIGDGAGPLSSPDGSRLAYVTRYQVNSPDGTPVTDTWVARADGTRGHRIAAQASPEAWSPDSTLLVARDAGGWFTIDSDSGQRTDLALPAADTSRLPWGAATVSWQNPPEND